MINSWDKNKQCLAQIIESTSKRTQLPHSGITVTIHDTEYKIQCKVIPQLIGSHGEQSFEKNRIINLTNIELRVSCDFNSVYFLLMDVKFLSSIPVLTVGKNRSFSQVNTQRIIKDAIKKYRTCLGFKFDRKPGDETAGFDINQIPFSLHSAQESQFGFDDEINASLSSNIDNNDTLQHIENYEDYNLAELCQEEDSEYRENEAINTINDEEEEHELQQDEGDDLEDNDEDMVEDEIKQDETSKNDKNNETETRHQDTNKNKKKSSDKEEMDEDEEKQIIEPEKETEIVTPGHDKRKEDEEEVDEKQRLQLPVRPKYIGNECDWMECLYPNFDDIPAKIKAMTIKPIEKPKHTPSKIPKKRKHHHVQESSSNNHNLASSKRQKISPSRVQQQFENNLLSTSHDHASQQKDYSQQSWGSGDILAIDQAVEKHKQMQQKQQMQKEQHQPHKQQIPFQHPTYSLTQRYGNMVNNYNRNRNINDSIVSVQESIASVDNNDNINILSQESVLITHEPKFRKREIIEDQDNDQDDEEEEQEKDDQDETDLNDLFGDVGSDDDNDMDHEEDFMNEAIDPDYLGAISRNDLDRIHRYFIKVGKILNADNNNNPNNPFRVPS